MYVGQCRAGAEGEAFDVGDTRAEPQCRQGGAAVEGAFANGRDGVGYIYFGQRYTSIKRTESYRGGQRGYVDRGKCSTFAEEAVGDDIEVVGKRCGNDILAAIEGVRTEGCERRREHENTDGRAVFKGAFANGREDGFVGEIY